MSNENVSKEEAESPPLFNYLKEKISIEEIRDYSSPERIESIDLVKGFAIIMIMLAHVSYSWFNEDWLFMHGSAFIMLDILGPSLFIFLSALSVVFSVKKKKGRMSDKVIRTRVFSRAGMIILIGLLINLGSVDTTLYPFPLNLWGWNILMFIGFSQIFSFYALKVKRRTRAIIGTFIIFISEPIRNALYLGKDEDFLVWIAHYIITSPEPTTPLLPFLSICFITTIFGEYLYDAMIKGTEEAYYHFFYVNFIWGVILIVFGVLTGLQSMPPGSVTLSEYPHFRLLEIANMQDYIHYPGMWVFLIRGKFANMWYNLGWSLLVVAICFYIIDIKKWNNNIFSSMLFYYGKTSLSLFLVHYIFIIIYFRELDLIFFIPVFISYVGFLGLIFYIWFEYFNGVGSPEWVIIQLGRIGQKTEEVITKEAKFTIEVTKKGIMKTEEITKKGIMKTEEIIKKEKEELKKLLKPKEESHDP
ncbi:MAG: heparan-alpha-glucosaminide N-acetyltransferase domain-containing protein [Promethearchaeota archaeon]